ncbi:MAG: DUF5666 domain-containing protein [Cocleimonas sp.]
MIKFIKFTLLVSLISVLVGCGGGGSSLDGGIDGTGITSGRITGFGSIIVNGVRFDVDNAIFSKDGVSSQQSDFLIGEYVVIKGSVDEAGINGTATEVIFENLLEGQITNVSVDGVSIEVLGQTIITNESTVFHEFTILTELSEGNILEISGLKDADGLIIATSIELEEESFVAGESENEIKGIISDVNATLMTFQIGSLIIDYSSADLGDFDNNPPIDGQFVEVKSDQPISDNTLVATKVELEEDEISSDTDLEINIEGLVTRYVSATDFDINGIAVTTNSTTEYEQGLITDLALNLLVEVEGKFNTSGILVADKVEFEDSDDEEDE